MVGVGKRVFEKISPYIMLPPVFIRVSMVAAAALLGLNAHAQSFSWTVNGITADHMGGREYSVSLPSGSTFADVTATPGSEKGDHVYMRYTFNNSLSLSSVPGWWNSSQNPWVDWTGDGGWEWRDGASSYSKRINGIPSSGSFRVIVECQNYDWTQSFVVNISVNAPSNQAPYTVWQILPPGTMQTGSWHAARATGHDSDGNLGGIWVEVSVNGGAWSPLAYDSAGANGGNGYATTSNNNGIVAGSAGSTYKFRCHAYDTAGANSGWTESGIHSVPVPVNQDPTASMEVLDSNYNPITLNSSGRAPLTLGQTFYVRVSAQDAEGALSQLYLRMNAPVIGQVGWGNVAVSGGSGSHNFGPFTASQTGIWDLWSHATDTTAGGYTSTPGNGWVDVYSPDLEVSAAPNQAPSVSLMVNDSSPEEGELVTWTATASDSDGVITEVMFYRNGSWVKTDTAMPYTYDFDGYAGESHSVYAVAKDNDGATDTSATVSMQVAAANVAPTVSLAVSNSAPVVGESVTWTATASDPDGSITEVKFYQGGSLVWTDTSSPYTYSYAPPAMATYNVSAEAKDNDGGTTTSNSVSIQAGAAPDTSAPSAPTSLQVVSSSAEHITVSWNSATDNVGVSGYEIWLQGVNLRGTVPGSATQATVNPFGPGSVNYVTVVAKDAAGNSSSPSNEVVVTTPSNSGLGDIGDGHFYTNINTVDDGTLLGDQIVDRVTTADSAIFNYFVGQWNTDTPNVSDYLFDSFSSLSIQLALSGGDQPADLFLQENTGMTFVGLLVSYQNWENYYTYFDLNFVIWGEAGEKVTIYSQDALPEENPDDPDGWPVDISRWEKIQFPDPNTGGLTDLIEFDTTGIHTISYTVDVLANFLKRQYFMVRYGEPIRGVNLDIADEFSLKLGLGDNVEEVTFPSGMSFTTGSSFGEIKLDTGTILQVIAGVVSKSSGGTIPTGTTQTIGGNTVSVDISGDVQVETAGGLVIQGNVATGAKSVVTSTGWGVSVDANGVVKLIIPSGASPLAKIVANAVDLLGKVVQIEQGAIWSVRDLLGNVVNIPSTGTPIDLLDLQVGPNGITAVGIKPSPESDTIWMEFPPTVQMESIDRMVHGSIDLSRFTFGGADVGLQLINNTSGEVYGPYDIGNPGNGVYVYDGFDALLSDSQTDDFTAGSLPSLAYEQDVVFIRDSGNSDLIHFYTTFEATGSMEAVVSYNGDEVDRVSHTLNEDLAFDELIGHIDLRIDERELSPPGLPADLHPDDVYASAIQGGASEILSIHRPGTLLAAGRELSEAEENNPLNLLLSLNSNLGPDGLPDNADETLNPTDSDLVKLVVRLPEGIEMGDGTFSLDSNAWHAVRVYSDETQKPLTRSDLVLDLSSPSGALAALGQTGSVTLWVEGMTEFGNVELSGNLTDSDGLKLADKVRLQTVGPLAFATYFPFVQDTDQTTETTLVDSEIQKVRFGSNESSVYVRTPEFSAVGNRAVRHRNLSTTTAIPLFTFVKQTGQIGVNYFKGIIDGAWDGAKSDYDALVGVPALVKDQIQAFYDNKYLAAKAIIDPIRELLDLTTQQKLFLVDTMLANFLSQAEQNTLWQSELGDPGLDTYISGYTTGLVTQKLVTGMLGAGAISSFTKGFKHVLSLSKAGQSVLSGVAAAKKFQTAAYHWVSRYASDLISAREYQELFLTRIGLLSTSSGKKFDELIQVALDNRGISHADLAQEMRLSMPGTTSVDQLNAVVTYGFLYYKRLGALISIVGETVIGKEAIEGFMKLSPRLVKAQPDGLNHFNRFIENFDTATPSGRQELDDFLRLAKDDLNNPNSSVDYPATSVPSSAYPSHDGFVGNIKLPRVFSDTEGLTFTRYIRKNTNPVDDGGSFVSIGDPAFEARALPGAELEYDKITYRVKQGQSISGIEGRATPWFTKSGGANQVKLDSSIETLLDNQKIEIISN